MYWKATFFLVINTTLASDNNPLRFGKKLSERISKLITATDEKIGDEKLQYDIKPKAAKILALSSRKICKYKYFTGEEILPS